MKVNLRMNLSDFIDTEFSELTPQTFTHLIEKYQQAKNELPFYEIVSGAAIAFAALLLILPGFATDIIGILLVFPVTRKMILSKY